MRNESPAQAPSRGARARIPRRRRGGCPPARGAARRRPRANARTSPLYFRGRRREDLFSAFSSPFSSRSADESASSSPVDMFRSAAAPAAARGVWSREGGFGRVCDVTEASVAGVKRSSMRIAPTRRAASAAASAGSVGTRRASGWLASSSSHSTRAALVSPPDALRRTHALSPHRRRQSSHSPPSRPRATNASALTPPSNTTRVVASRKTL